VENGIRFKPALYQLKSKDKTYIHNPYKKEKMSPEMQRFLKDLLEPPSAISFE
jgi:hypothetical protein